MRVEQLLQVLVEQEHRVRELGALRAPGRAVREEGDGRAWRVGGDRSGRSSRVLFLLALGVSILALTNKFLLDLFLVEWMQETLLQYFPNLIFNLILIILAGLLVSRTLEVGLGLAEGEDLTGH